MAHPLLQKAAEHIAQARRINDEFEGKQMPADAAHQMQQHLDAATEYKRHANLEASLTTSEAWLHEPQYKHDMSGGYGGLGGQSFDTKGYGGYDSVRREVTDFCRFLREGKSGSEFHLEHKADLVENATGQSLVPSDYAGTIIKQMAREGTIRPLAYIRPTTKNVVDVGSVVINTAGWGKLETGTVATDGLGATPAAKDTITVWDLNCLVKIGNDELDDNDDNLAVIVRDAVSAKFAELEDDAYAGGSGTSQPWGISHGVTQNVTAAVNATVTSDDLKKLQYAVPAQFRKNGSYLAHSSAAQAVSLLKDTTGRYLVQPAASLGEPEMLFGKAYYTVDGLTSMTTTGTATDVSMMFGDIRAGYMIADRQKFTVQVLRELYATEGKTGLLMTLRVGGDTVRSQALARSYGV
jgi:HK97 family phage major capsid protein